MLALEEAVSRILDALPAPTVESVSLAEAEGRVLGQSIVSPLALPPFDNSAMDGYAVRAQDVGSARAEAPVHLRLVGKAAAGQQFAGTLGEGECVRVFTGSPLPPGADAVVMQEDTRVAPERTLEVLVLDKTAPWENVRFRGEDIKNGATLAETGQCVTAAQLTLFAATGLENVPVGRQPVVGLLATGSELARAGQPLAPAQIYESNRVGLAALARKAGACCKILPLVQDTLEATQGALERAFQETDIVVTSGGVSVGEMDFVKRAFEETGGQLQFWKVAIKPGRPFVFGTRNGKFLFGLPGNPVSAFVTFLLLVRPALLHWQGASSVALLRQTGVLGEPLSNPGSRRHFMRVKRTNGKVFSSGVQASHTLSSLAAADGLVDMLPDTTLPAGSPVEVLSW